MRQRQRQWAQHGEDVSQAAETAGAAGGRDCVRGGHGELGGGGFPSCPLSDEAHNRKELWGARAFN